MTATVATAELVGPVRRHRTWSTTVWVVGLAVGLLLSMGLAVGLGPVPIDQITVWQVIGHRVAPGLVPATDVPDTVHAIVLDIRAPRVMAGAVVGAGLAVAGAVLQAILRNPLADPYLIGVSSGAALGAVSVIMLGIAPLGLLSLPVAAFAGAMLAFGVVLALTVRGGQLAPTRFLLAGVAVAAIADALTGYIVLTSDDKQVRSALFWALGGLGGTQWRDLGPPIVVVGIAVLWFRAHANPLNGLAIGEEGATSLGIEVDRLRRRMSVAAALVVGVLVAVSGGIGFVALIVPHIVRLVVGSDHRRLLPVTALTGAIFLVWVDVAARLVNQPDEIPIGVLTAMLGAPFFLYLLTRDARRRATAAA